MSFLVKKSSSVDLEASAYENPFFKTDEPALVSYSPASKEVVECKQNPELILHSSFTPVEIDSQPDRRFLLQWTNLCVAVPFQQGQRLVLDGVSGQINNQQMIAVLGPSGAGKSSLLNFVSGKMNRKQRLSGDVRFFTASVDGNENGTHNQDTFAYVPQEDPLNPYLTVEETLLLASRLKNHRKADFDHKTRVNEVIQQFGLRVCCDQLALNCSGGERKRLSIACEMLCNPSILLLDEPTSGLDSSTSFKVMEVLKSLSQKTAILTTIHQPNSQLFSLFSKVYVLAAGSCIYFGPPDHLVNHLGRYSLNCPVYTNPADFILAVATRLQDHRTLNEVTMQTVSSHKQQQKLRRKLSECGLDFMPNLNGRKPNNQDKKLFTGFSEMDRLDMTKLLCDLRADYCETPLDSRLENIGLQQVQRQTLHQQAPFNVAFPLLVDMFKKSFWRDPMQTLIRLANCLTLPLMIILITRRGLGSERGCAFIQLNSTHVMDESTYDRMERQQVAMRNVGLTYLNMMYAYFIGLIPAVVSLNIHVNVFRKHIQNGYYGPCVFLVALLSVCTVCTILFATLNATAYYFATNQIYACDKFVGFILLTILTTLIGEYSGLLLNLLLPKSNVIALIFSSSAGFSLYTLSGFFVPVKEMQDWLATATKLLFCRHSFEANLRLFYGSSSSELSMQGHNGLTINGGCSLSDDAGFSFNQLRELIAYYNHETLKDDQNMGLLPSKELDSLKDLPYKVRLVLQYKLWTKRDMLQLFEALNDLSEQEVQRVDRFWDTKMDMILGYYGVHPEQLWINYAVIFLTWVALLLIILMVVKIKYKP